MTLLQCENITYRPPGSSRDLFRDFGLELDLNQRTILIGDSGTGKTTFGLLLAGGLEPESGRILINGELLSQSDIRIGFLRQNPENQIIGTTVERDVAYGLENDGTEPSTIRKRVEESLRVFDMYPFRHTPVTQLAGGQKQRTALAALMATECDYLILDEPTSFLDYPSQTVLYKTMDQLHSQGIGILWITQYPEEQILGDRVVELSEDSSVREYTPSAVRTDSPADNPEKESFATKNSGQKVMVQIDELRYTYEKPDDDTFVLQVEQYRLRQGEKQGWYGYSGTGKSTLAKLLAGILPRPGNAIRLNISAEDIIYVPQFAERLLHTGTLEETIDLLHQRNGFDEQEYRIELRFWLSAMNLISIEPFSRPIWMYSGGEQRRIVLAVAAALTPKLLILDEPTIGVSPEDRSTIKKLFTSEKLSTIICISHEYEFLKTLTNNGVYFNNGKVFAAKSWEALEARYDYQTRRYLPSGEESLPSRILIS